MFKFFPDGARASDIVPETNTTTLQWVAEVWVMLALLRGRRLFSTARVGRAVSALVEQGHVAIVGDSPRLTTEGHGIACRAEDFGHL